MASGEVSAARTTISEVPRLSVLVAVDDARSAFVRREMFERTNLHWHPFSAVDSDWLVESRLVSIARAGRQLLAMLPENQYQYYRTLREEEMSMAVVPALSFMMVP